MSCLPNNSYPRYYRGQKRTAFDWAAYANRCCSLRLLKENKIHVDTLIETRDGFSDTIHWQVLFALCPELIAASQLKELEENHKYSNVHRNLTKSLLLPRCINGFLAKKLIDCAYGEPLYFTRTTLCDFYTLSNRYNIVYSLKLCLNHAKDLIDSYNCIRLLQLSIKHEHHKLKRATYIMIRQNFKKIVQYNQDFHLLPFNIFKQLLLDDFLKIDENEELSWLAIVRWLSHKPLTSKALNEMYNQMVTIRIPMFGSLNVPQQERNQRNNQQVSMIQQQLISRGFSTTNSQFDTSLIYHPYPFEKYEKSTRDIKKDHDSISGIVSRRDFPKQIKNENVLLELLKCLRFMRFRSISSFTVILSHQAIKGNEKLIQFVEYMKLRYIIRKNLPLDKEYAKQMLPEGKLSLIKKSEKTKSQRLIDSVTKLVGLQTPTIIPVQMSMKQLGKQETSATNIPFANVANFKNAKSEDVKPIKLSESTLNELNKHCLRQAQEPRVPSSVAFLIGGWSDGAVSKSILSYDFVCDKWFKLNIQLPEARCFHASCSSPKSGEIFILGGTNGDQILSSVLRFQPNSDISLKGRCKGSKRSKCDLCLSKKYHGLSYRFHVLRPMTERRCHLSSVFHTDGKMYAIGGHNGQQRLRSGECYDQRNDEWLRIAEMTIARSDASACSHENKIFVAGGQIGDQYIQASVEFYKANDNTWTFAAPMIVPRMSFKLVSYKSHLLAIGGTNGLIGGDEIGSLTRSVERYEANHSSWSLCAPMSQKRSSFDTLSIKNKLLVVGGHGGRHKLRSCESLMIGLPAGHASSSSMRTIQSPVAPARPPQARVRDSSLSLTRQLNPFQQAVGFRENSLGVNSTPSLMRSAMRWEKRAKLPSKRSGFTIAVIDCPLTSARRFTYHGANKKSTTQSKGQTGGRASVVRQKSRWHKLKFMKRRKLIKHLKIAIVVTIVILIM